MIDLYYESEKPIPADDINRLAKRVGAKTDEDRAALVEVLTEFFYLENGAYHHSRCDAEILIYKEKIEKASLAGKASALSRAKRAVNKRSTSVKQTLNETPTPNPNPTTQSQSYLKAEARATRLPTDWFLPDEWQKWAEDELGWSPQAAGNVADRFKDYWIAKAGKDAKKTDWQATWRNWCRSEKNTIAQQSFGKTSQAIALLEQMKG